MSDIKKENPVTYYKDGEDKVFNSYELKIKAKQ